MITPNDHPCDGGLASLSEIRRHPIIQSQEFSTQKSADIDDQMSADPENPHQKEVPGVIIKGDHQVIMGDHSDRPPAFKIGDTVATSDLYSAQYTWHGCIENSRNSEEWLVRWAERKGKPGRETDWYFTSELRLVEEAIATEEVKPATSAEDFEVGDKVWVEAVSRNPPYSGEATVTAIGNKYLSVEVGGQKIPCEKSEGNKYLSVEVGGQKIPCEKSEAKILSRAETTTSSDEENAIATATLELCEGQKVRWNGMGCEIIKLWKHKAKIRGYNPQNNEFITQTVLIEELKES